MNQNRLRLLLIALLWSAPLAAQTFKSVDGPKVAAAARPTAAPALPGAIAGLAGATKAATPAVSAPGAQTAHAAPADAAAQVRAIKERLNGQLDAMQAELGGPDPIFDHVRTEGHGALDAIASHVEAGVVQPALSIRTHADDDKIVQHPGRPIRVGVYPVAGDPLQWAHLLIGLRAMAQFKLDKVIYVFAGDDPRKPNMTKAAQRHPMGQAVLDVFSPLFEYSPIAVGTNHDGETNIFRMLSLNAELPVHAVYLVGGDHYKLKDKNGNDDTLPKIEKKLASGTAGYNPDKHAVSVGFVSRGEEGQAVPTTLDVHFLTNVPFDASSTLVRGGKIALMPHAALAWIRAHAPGLFGLR